jgi:hypothetical protein
MGREIRVEDVRAELDRYFAAEREMGVRKAVVNLMFKPANPFEPTMKRNPRRWFVLFSFLLTVGTCAFLYFNFG